VFSNPAFELEYVLTNVPFLYIFIVTFTLVTFVNVQLIDELKFIVELVNDIGVINDLVLLITHDDAPVAGIVE
jgi:hypothetical protein